MRKIDIVYEDKYLIVVNKPTNLLCISTSNEREKTLFHQVFTYLKNKNKNNKLFIVHRLDKDTSGLIVFAKGIKIKNALQENWASVKREYTVVVEGIVKKETGEIKSFIKETKTLLSYSTDKKDGKLAITKYKKIKHNNLYTMLLIDIMTGRKNQIRVHMKDIGHPVIGDKKYGSRLNPIKRLGLHATKLIFNHPILKKEFTFEAKVPTQFERLFKSE